MPTQISEEIYSRILEKISNPHEAFYEINEEESAILLNNQPFGTYLFCSSPLNESSKNVYVSCVIAGEPEPIRLFIDDEGKLWNTIGANFDKGRISYKSLTDFINQHQAQLPILKPFSKLTTSANANNKKLSKNTFKNIFDRQDFSQLTHEEASAKLLEKSVPVGTYLLIIDPEYDQSGSDNLYLRLLIKERPEKPETFEEDEHTINSYKILNKLNLVFTINDANYGNLDDLLTEQAKKWQKTCKTDLQPFLIDDVKKQNVIEKFNDDLYFRLLESVTKFCPRFLSFFKVLKVLTGSALEDIDKANIILEARKNLNIAVPRNKNDYNLSDILQAKYKNNIAALEQNQCKFIQKLFQNKNTAIKTSVQTTFHAPTPDAQPKKQQPSEKQPLLEPKKPKRSCCF